MSALRALLPAVEALSASGRPGQHPRRRELGREPRDADRPDEPDLRRDEGPAGDVEGVGEVRPANAALRPEVIPKAPTSTDAEQAAPEARTLKRRDGPTPSLR